MNFIFLILLILIIIIIIYLIYYLKHIKRYNDLLNQIERITVEKEEAIRNYHEKLEEIETIVNNNQNCTQELIELQHAKTSVEELLQLEIIKTREAQEALTNIQTINQNYRDEIDELEKTIEFYQMQGQEIRNEANICLTNLEEKLSEKATLQTINQEMRNEINRYTTELAEKTSELEVCNIDDPDGYGERLIQVSSDLRKCKMKLNYINIPFQFKYSIQHQINYNIIDDNDQEQNILVINNTNVPRQVTDDNIRWVSFQFTNNEFVTERRPYIYFERNYIGYNISRTIDTTTVDTNIGREISIQTDEWYNFKITE